MSELIIFKEINSEWFEYFIFLLCLYKYSINKKIKMYYVSYL